MNERELLDAAGRLPKSIEPPRDLWPGIEARLGWRASARPRVWIPLALAAVFALVLLARTMLETTPGWGVAPLAGRPLLNAAPLAGEGTLRVGQWIQTDDSSRALIEVGAIGHVEVKQGTRIRLLEAKPNDHRLDLAYGAIYAKVDTIPRLFFVETPAGTAIDLGCAYTLETDSAGNGRLHVVGGIVEFQTGQRFAKVPMGAMVDIAAGVGPGIPFVEDAPAALRRALESGDVRAALRAARSADAVSLWHLLQRVAPDQRAAVYDRLAALVPPPTGVTRAAAVALEPETLDRYWATIHRILFRRMVLRGVREIDPRTGTTVR
jgi:hypothetical protein